MERIYQLSYELKELLSSDERVILLNSLEKEMNDNEEVMKLSYKKDMEVSNLEFMMNHFSNESEEVKMAQKKLHEAKLELDNHPLVRKYLNAYSEVRDLYMNINEKLFSVLNVNLCSSK